MHQANWRLIKQRMAAVQGPICSLGHPGDYSPRPASGGGQGDLIEMETGQAREGWRGVHRHFRTRKLFLTANCRV